MTIQYTVYDASSGAILRTGTALTRAQADLQGSAPGTRVVVVGSDPETEVIDTTPIPIGQDPATIPKTSMKVGSVLTATNKTNFSANGTDFVSISPIPSGATYEVVSPTGKGLSPNYVGSVNDGTLEITTTVTGVYSVTLKYPTSLDFKVTLNAT